MGHRVPELPRLNAILDADAAQAAGWSMPDLARACLAGGARFLQVRAKRLSSREYLAMCDEVVELSRPHDAIVIVNDRADIARLCGAAGVHVGQEDLPAAAARQVLGEAAMVGLSTHTSEQIGAGLMEPVDYIAVGPLFGTSTKDTGYAAVGLDLVDRAAGMARAAASAAGASARPIVGIGGITLARARCVIEAGAASVAVISDLLSTGDPESHVREYLEILGEQAGL
jgi:thiamine-phosphate pyrophosphorylase